MQSALLIVTAYLIGAIPFGFLIGRAKGIDIRDHGSRNIGATNVGRVLGKKWGMLCLLLDILKGFLPTLIASTLLLTRPPTAEQLLIVLGVAIGAFLGHLYPIYLAFRGGKGVATTIGIALGVWPYLGVPMLACLLVFAVFRIITGIVSIGSLAVAVLFPVAVWGYAAWWEALGMDRAWPLVAGAALIGLLIIVRHRSNIVRLLRGEELRATRTAAAADKGSAVKLSRSTSAES